MSPADFYAVRIGAWLRVVVDGVAFALPADRARRVLEAPTITPTPGLTTPFLGLIPGDDGPLCLACLALALGLNPRPGGAALVVDLAAGPLALRVDAARAEETFPADARPLDLDALFPQLRAVATPQSQRPATPARSSQLSFLIAEIGATAAALPSAAIAKVGRVETARRGWGAARPNLVVVDGEALALVELDPETTEPIAPGAWVVVVAGATRTALRTRRLGGLIDVDPAALRRVAHPQGRDGWWLERDDGPLEILDPRALCRGAPDLSFLTQSIVTPTLARDPDAAAGLTLRCGAYHALLPAFLARRVFSRETPLAKRRDGAAVPVFDAGMALGLRDHPLERPTLVALGPEDGAPVLALAVDAIAPAPWTERVVPLPPGPPAFAALFDALAWGGDAWRPRLRWGDAATLRAIASPRLWARARRGWLDLGASAPH